MNMEYRMMNNGNNKKNFWTNLSYPTFIIHHTRSIDRKLCLSFNERGQVILILLLTMLVALSIGLVVTQKSITDLATSNQTEQSTRAFSAAEAGLEEIIQRGDSGYGINTISSLGDGASAKVDAARLPAGNEALEYPPIGKEIVAQVWLANPDRSVTPHDGPELYYEGDSVDVYFGNKGMSDKNLKDVDQFSDNSRTSNDFIEYRPAVSLTFVNRIQTGIVYEYKSYKVYLDSFSGARNNPNNFKNASTGVNCSTLGHSLTTTSGTSKFYCKKTVQILKDEKSVEGNLAHICNRSNGCEPILIRIRVLYATEPQKVAINPVACPNPALPAGSPCLPFQASRYISTGQVGQSQKTIEVFRVKKVVPPWFDFAIFSAGEIKK